MTEHYTPRHLLAAIVVTAEDGAPTPVRIELDEIAKHATLTFATKADARRWLPHMEIDNDGGWLWHGWTVELNGPHPETSGQPMHADRPSADPTGECSHYRLYRTVDAPCADCGATPDPVVFTEAHVWVEPPRCDWVDGCDRPQVHIGEALCAPHIDRLRAAGHAMPDLPAVTR